jgi:hypothetical protein
MMHLRAYSSITLGLTGGSPSSMLITAFTELLFSLACRAGGARQLIVASEGGGLLRRRPRPFMERGIDMAYQLTKADIKGLDYLIAALEEKQEGARVEKVDAPFFTPVAAIVAANISVEATPGIAVAAVALARAIGTEARREALPETALAMPEELSLEQLKELRARIKA